MRCEGTIKTGLVLKFMKGIYGLYQACFSSVLPKEASTCDCYMGIVEGEVAIPVVAPAAAAFRPVTPAELKGFEGSLDPTEVLVEEEGDHISNF